MNNLYLLSWVGAAIVMALMSYYLKSRHGISLRKYSHEEEEEIINNWTPEPLRTYLSNAQKRNGAKQLVILKSNSTRVTLNGVDDIINAANCNYLGMSGNAQVAAVGEATMRKYGVGSCGPRGFYGTVDVHLFLEKRIAAFMGTEDAILYSSSFSAVSSAVPAFSKKGDIIICDEGVSHATQTGVGLSRSTVFYFKHNDVNDLERILVETMPKNKSELVRKFVIVEGLYFNYGDIAPLKEIMALKDKYFFRMILDETHSFGVLGNSGRGVCELTGVNRQDIEILTGSLAHAFGAGGGFCCGNRQVIYHQRLNGAGYCFSASEPPYVATSAHTAIDLFDADTTFISNLRKNVSEMQNLLKTVPGLLMVCDERSPVIHLRLEKSFGSRDADEEKLESIVEYSLQYHKVLISRAKYVDVEKFLPSPSIRVCVNAAFDKKEIDTIYGAISQAARFVL